MVILLVLLLLTKLELLSARVLVFIALSLTSIFKTLLRRLLRIVVRLRISVFFIAVEISVDFLLLNLVKAFYFYPCLRIFSNLLGNYKVAADLSRLV